jgi:hypothetical protein
MDEISQKSLKASTPKKDTITQAEIESATREIERTLLADYRMSLTKVGISTDRVAKLRAQEMKAVKCSHIKIKGALPKQLKLPKGYKVVTPTERLTIKSDDGGDIVVDPGETIIEFSGPDWSVRDKALQAIEAIMGYRSEESQAGGGQTIIIVQSMIPEPRPAIDADVLDALWAVKAGGNGNGGGH